MNEYTRGKQAGHKFVELAFDNTTLGGVEEEARKVLKEVDASQYSIGFAKGTLEAIEKTRGTDTTLKRLRASLARLKAVDVSGLSGLPLENWKENISSMEAQIRDMESRDTPKV
jgi:hypothetical protein